MSVIGVAMVPNRSASPLKNGSAAASMAAGSIIGSSPWMLTMRSQSTRPATSASRSVPERWVSDVIS